MDFFSGMVKQIINGTVFVFVFATHSVTQIYLELQMIKLKQIQNSTGNAQFGDIIKKTGLSSLIVITVILIQFLLQFVFPGNTLAFYLAKDLFSNTLIFVIYPLVLIIKNKSILKFISHYFADSEICFVYFYCIEAFSCKISKNKVSTLC
jgi:hypothetical protein